MRVARHKVDDSTLWTVFSGRLGEARSLTGDCRSSVSSPMTVGRRADQRT